MLAYSCELSADHRWCPFNSDNSARGKILHCVSLSTNSINPCGLHPSSPREIGLCCNSKYLVGDYRNGSAYWIPSHSRV